MSKSRETIISPEYAGKQRGHIGALDEPELGQGAETVTDIAWTNDKVGLPGNCIFQRGLAQASLEGFDGIRRRNEERNNDEALPTEIQDVSVRCLNRGGLEHHCSLVERLVNMG